MTLTRPTSVRLSQSLYDRVQSAAAKENRSISNWIQMAISYFLDAHEEGYEPNEVTVSAINEAQSGKNLETLDLDDFNSFINSL